MDWLWYFSLVALLFTGLALNIVGLPGLWLMVAAHALYAWATGWTFVGWSSSIALLALATAAEIVEFIAGAAGSKTAGGSIRSMIGAITGGIIGAIVFSIALVWLPVLNAILGACIGSFVGAMLLEATVVKQEIETAKQSWNRAAVVGWGAFKGRLLGIIAKTAFGVVMIVVSLITAWG